MLGCGINGSDDFEAAEKFAENRTLGTDVRRQCRIGDSMTTNAEWVGTYIDAGPPTGEVSASSEAGRIEEFFEDERVGWPNLG